MATNFSIGDYQNFDIDIDKEFTKYIQQIDAARSDSDTSARSASISVNDFFVIPTSGVRKTNPPTKAESRCHAMYRIIGLPVVSVKNPTSFFSPGIDLDKSPDWLNLKKTISNEFIKSNLEQISSLRESRVIAAYSIFGHQDSVASIEALVLMNPRIFSESMKNGSGFDLKKEDQAYTISFLDSRNVDMFEYKDDFGVILSATPDFASVKSNGWGVNRVRLIKPTVVDPRIMFSASEDRQFRVPFIKDPNDTAINKYSAPFIETVIREKIENSSLVSTSSEYERQTIDFIKTLPSNSNFDINNNEIKKIYGNSVKSFEKFKFLDFLNLSRALVAKLQENVKVLQDTQSKYHWFPIVSKVGPESGCTPKPISLTPQNIDANNEFFTTIDNDIISQRISAILNDINRFSNLLISQANQIEKNAGLDDKTGKQNSSLQNSQTFSSGADRPQAENSVKTLEKTREQETTKACESIKKVEYIMGEYTGFGLCDVYVMIYALYLIDVKYLLGLIDSKARARAADFPYKLSFNESNIPPVQDCLIQLENMMKNLYELMDSIRNQ